MRVHFYDEPKKVLLCGARIIECGLPNAPVFNADMKSFEALPSKSRCIKCSKKLSWLKTRRQKAGQRAVVEWLHSEMEKEIKKRLLEDLDYAAHEAVFGVPCGPTLSMIKTTPIDATIGADLYDNLMERARDESLHSS